MGCSGPLYNKASPEQPLLSCSIFVHRFSSMACPGPLYNTASPEQPPLSCSIFVHRFSLIVDLRLARRNARSAWNINLLTPKRLQNELIFSLLLALLALLLVRFAMCSLLPPLKKGLWLQSRAVFASKPRLQKRWYAYPFHFAEFRMQSVVFFLHFMLYTYFFIFFV